MPSSPGTAISSGRVSALFLAGVALFALVLSLLLTFLISRPHAAPNARGAFAGAIPLGGKAHTPPTAVPAPSPRFPSLALPAPARARVVHPGTGTRASGAASPLWTLLAPWTLRLDGLAVLGFVLAFVLRPGSARRRKARA